MSVSCRLWHITKILWNPSGGWQGIELIIDIK